MALLVHNGQRHIVEVDDANMKTDLIGFSIDGEHKGNVRVYPDHYRIGLGATAEDRPITTPIEEVISDAARKYLDTVSGQKWARRKR